MYTNLLVNSNVIDTQEIHLKLVIENCLLEGARKSESLCYFYRNVVIELRVRPR